MRIISNLIIQSEKLTDDIKLKSLREHWRTYLVPKFYLGIYVRQALLG